MEVVMRDPPDKAQVCTAYVLSINKGSLLQDGVKEQEALRREAEGGEEFLLAWFLTGCVQTFRQGRVGVKNVQLV